MKSELDKDLSSFIEAVANSDLETFHSKALAWYLNRLDPSHVLFEKLIEHLKVKYDTYHHVGTISEFKRHDLVTCLKVALSGNVTWHLIIWENKIKADFSSKDTKGLDLKLNKKAKDDVERYLHHWKRPISQPYWYQLRMGLWRSNSNTWSKILEDYHLEVMDVSKLDSKHEFPSEYKVHWLILSPYDKKHLEVFHRHQWEGMGFLENCRDKIRGDRSLVRSIFGEALSDWEFITYKTLFESMKNDRALGDDQPVMRSYLHALERIHERYALSLHGGADSSNPSERERRERWTLPKLLQLYYELKGDDRLDFYWEIAGSENNANPLFKIRMRPGGAFDNLSNNQSLAWDSILDLKGVKKSAVDFITCSVLVQGSVKLQFAHCAYNLVRLQGSAEYYVEFVFSALDRPVDVNKHWEIERKIIIEELVNGNQETFKVTSENIPKSRSGLSYSIDLKEKQEDVLCVKHVKELVENVQANLVRFCRINL